MNFRDAKSVDMLICSQNFCELKIGGKGKIVQNRTDSSADEQIFQSGFQVWVMEVKTGFFNLS